MQLFTQQHTLAGLGRPYSRVAGCQLPCPAPAQLHRRTTIGRAAEPTVGAGAADEGGAAAAAAAPAGAAPQDGIERVPISELPKPHPKAQKTLSKSMNKAGVYKALVDTLNSVSFTIACDDQELGWELAQGLGKRIGWFPVNTGRVLAGMHQLEVPKPAAGTGGAGGSTVPREQLLTALGSDDALAAAELDVLKGLRTQKRIIACTLPGAALARPDSWREVWGTLIVWLDEDDRSAPKPKTLERKILGNKAEVLVRLKKQRGFMGAKTAADKAQVALDALMKELVHYLNGNPDIVENKHKYVAYGCRGDWPVVQPPDWSPVTEAFGRKPLTLPDTAATSSADVSHQAQGTSTASA